MEIPPKNLEQSIILHIFAPKKDLLTMYLRARILTSMIVLASVVCNAQTADSTRYESSAIGFALRTNMLYDVALIPNVGAELYLGRQWTVGVDWFYTRLSSESNNRCWQGYGGYLTLRRYFGQPFTGHHVGAYALGLTYDVEFGGKGYQADHFGFGAGVEYGYSLPVSRSFILDFTLGLGFQDGEYKTYEPMDGHYVWQSTNKRHWLGPTKAEVSLKWMLGKKGGRR